MTQFFTYAGVGLGDTTVRLNGSVHEGVPGVTQNADGTYAVGGVTIDDSTGARTFVELQEFDYDETACARSRIFTGFLTNMRVSRGPYVNGAGRIYDFDLMDLNYLLHLQPFRGADAKRKAETGDQRMAWLLSSVAMSGFIFDNGLVGPNPNVFDEADYTRQYADAVLSDLCVSSSADTGRIFFVYRDATTGQASLFLDRPTAVTYTSSLSISNDLTDSSATCFPPFRDAELGSSGEDIYCSVFFTYKTGTIYRHNATTHATYFAGKGYHRQGVFESTRIGSLATATRHADAWLANHAGTLDEVTCVVQLPKESVNLIEAGMRVSSKFIHLPGYDTFGYLRVASRSVVPTSGDPELYDVHLTLTNRTITPVGGGGAGGFPHPPPGPPDADETKAGHGSIVLDNLPADGKLILAAMTKRGGSPSLSSLPGSWTSLPAGTAAPYDLVVGWRLASAESVLTYSGGAGAQLVVAVYPAGTTIGLTADQDNITGVAVDCGGPVASGAASTVWGFAINNYFFGETFVAPTGTVVWNHIDASSNPPGFMASYQTATVPTATLANSAVWAGVTVELLSSAADNPPMSGQEVPWAVVTMTGANGTTAFPYAAGSLRVKVDGVLISTASYTESDPACGDFTLSWSPDSDEVVTVSYQSL